jgi:hypothetical protein
VPLATGGPFVPPHAARYSIASFSANSVPPLRFQPPIREQGHATYVVVEVAVAVADMSSHNGDILSAADEYFPPLPLITRRSGRLEQKVSSKER